MFIILHIPASEGRTPKYFPVNRKVRDIIDFVWPVRIKSNSEIKINVSTTSGGLEIGYIIPPGFTSKIYFKNAVTGEVYYTYNYTGEGEEGGSLHYYIKNKSPCIIGLDGVGMVDLMWFPYSETIDSARNVTSFEFPDPMAYHIPNPSYFKFKTPPDICIYSFSYTTFYGGPFKLIDMDESTSTKKTVIVEEDNGDTNAISFAFFVFYNKSGGPVHDVKLVDYGPYKETKSLPPIYGLIPISLILIAVGVTYYWMKKEGK